MLIICYKHDIQNINKYYLASTRIRAIGCLGGTLMGAIYVIEYFSFGRITVKLCTIYDIRCKGL